MATKSKGVQVSGTVRPELAEAIESHRWDVRKSKSEIVVAAIEEYAANHNLTVQAPEAPAPEA